MQEDSVKIRLGVQMLQSDIFDLYPTKKLPIIENREIWHGAKCCSTYSAVAVFCHNIVSNLPIQIKVPAGQPELLYINALVDEILDARKGKLYRYDCDRGCSASV